MKKLFIFLGLFLLSFMSFSQSWKEYLSNKNLKIEYQYSNCNDDKNDIHQEKIFFRYTNLTENTIEINESISATYTNNGKEFQTKGDVPELIITLKPGEVLEGHCLEKTRTLVLFSKMLNTEASELKEFTITINNIKTK